MYATTHSFPSFCSWESTAPIPVSLALVSSINCCDKLGSAKVGAAVSHVFRKLKAFSHSGVQVKVIPLSVSQCNGFAMVAKSLMNQQ